MPIINNKLNPIDSELSSTSEHPVQNKVVKNALDNKQDTLPTVVNDRYLHTNGSTGALEWSKIAEIDSDVLVEIETTASDDYANRTNYATAISLQEFIANCENGTYTTAGIIARISNLISRKTFRLILIGTNHEVLASDDTTYAKTTWQFLDMPMQNVYLGLPFNLLDWGSGSGRDYLMQYLNGINSSTMYLYPSNKDGLISASGLLDSCHVVFESLPTLLKEHIKQVRRYYYRQRNNMSVGANGGSETNSSTMCQMASNLFHLSKYDLDNDGQTEGSGSQYTYFNSSARKVRFYNGSAKSWWSSSPNTNNNNNWRFVYANGSSYDSDATYSYKAIAPAFCI